MTKATVILSESMMPMCSQRETNPWLNPPTVTPEMVSAAEELITTTDSDLEEIIGQEVQ